MKIISTNISKLKTINYNGKDVKTGIFKTPTDKAVSINKLNIAGDEQGDLINHGGEHKAVYAFALEHYKYWRTLLNNPDLSAGIFGENFTVSNLYEQDINIGDQFWFGTALLEVSQPRVPCYKLGIALNNKKALKLFTQSFCTGVYFRVIQSGVAQSGDIISLEKKATNSISVKQLFQAYFDSQYIGAKDVFLKALCIDALAPEWQDKLKKRLNNKVN